MVDEPNCAGEGHVAGQLGGTLWGTVADLWTRRPRCVGAEPRWITGPGRSRCRAPGERGQR